MLDSVNGWLFSLAQFAAKLAMQKCKIFYIFLAVIHKSADNTVFCGVGTGAGSARAIVQTGAANSSPGQFYYG